MKDYDQLKQNKVTAQNECNAHLNEIVPLLRKWMEPFLGQQVIKANGGYMKKFIDCKPSFSMAGSAREFRWWTTATGYSIRVNGSQCVTDSNGTVYAESSVYLSDLRDGVLTKMYPIESPLKTDYDVAEIKVLLEKIDAKKKEIDILRAALGDFRDGINTN